MTKNQEAVAEARHQLTQAITAFRDAAAARDNARVAAAVVDVGFRHARLAATERATDVAAAPIQTTAAGAFDAAFAEARAATTTAVRWAAEYAALYGSGKEEDARAVGEDLEERAASVLRQLRGEFEDAFATSLERAAQSLRSGAA